MDLMRITEAPDSIAVTGDLYNFLVNDNGNLKQVDKEVLRTYFNNGKANTWNDLQNKPFTTLESEQFNVLAGIMSINGYHTHNNTEILDKFALDENNSLVYDGSPIGGYVLPIATEETLGGIKPDGTTITVDEDGTIHGANTYELPTATTDVLGGVKVDGDTIKINDGIISADVIGNWSAGTSYPVGYFVVYGEGMWECMVAHTSQNAFDESKWMPVAFRAIKVYNWGANTDYYLYQLVIYNSMLYRAKEKHTSGDNFDESKWELISGGTTGTTINNWTATTDYVIGDLVINETTLYQCNTGHTSGETFDDTESANWTTLSGEKGVKGDDGFSPTVSAEQTDTGCTVTVIDKNGTTTANLINGTDGITPTIDKTTKHWMVGDTDTGIVAEGTTTISTTSITYTGTLTTSGWSDSSPYIQTVNISGITADIEPIIDLVVSDDVTTSDEEIAQWSYITKAVTENNAITFRCNKTKPTIELNFKVKVV